MVANISNFLTSPTLSTISQNTVMSVTAETATKAVGRPAFILGEKDLDSKTKAYAATRECLYQIISLVVYLLLVVPIFKDGSFILAKKFMKGEPAFQKFNSAKQYLDYKKLASMNQENRLTTLKKDKYKDRFSEDIKNQLKNEKEPDQYNKIKGAIELGNIIGSIVGLAIFAPYVSNMLIHPSLRFLGLEKKEKEQVAKSEQVDNNTNKKDNKSVDVSA